ncbi:MAG: hypothetical protein MUC86_10995 [Burkholderiaceae bacterium]|jgi:hypothetical protein|nr:hypothetical protein [Burkholderiaceae bacterium]
MASPDPVPGNAAVARAAGTPSSATHPSAPRWVAAALLLWLSLLVLGTGFASAVLLSSADDYADSTSYQMVLCMTGGALGASLTALLAAGERIAHGWSFASDALARGERGFSARLAPLLAVQPILGAALGMLLLLLLSSGAVMLLRLTEGTTFDPMGLLLVAVVVGLFARSLVARLRDSAEALFGRARAAASPAPGAPVVATASPASDAAVERLLPPPTATPTPTKAEVAAEIGDAADAANAASISPRAS